MNSAAAAVLARRFQEGKPGEGKVSLTGRCLLRLRDGRVAQSVLPLEDLRVAEALSVHGVPTAVIPLEPRCAAQPPSLIPARPTPPLLAPPPAWKQRRRRRRRPSVASPWDV